MSKPEALRRRLQLTDRGWRTLVCSLVVCFLGFLFRDMIMVVLALTSGIVLVYVFLGMRGALKRLPSLVVLEPDGFEYSMTAGESFSGNLRIESSLGVSLRFISPFEDLGFEPSELGIGDSSLRFVLHSRLAGEYNSEELRLDIMDRFELVRGEGGLPFHLSFLVYPRVVEAAVEAVSFLLEAGGVGLWEQPTRLKGGGLEYADSRLYMPGDSLRRMDWKATARLGRLVVKEYYVEGGLKTHIVYEASAPDPVSLDELSASFLRAVLAFARMRMPLGLTVHDGDETLYHGVEITPGLAVAQATRYALKGVESGFEQLYEVLDPQVARDFRHLLGSLEDSPLWTLMETYVRGQKKGVNQPSSVLEEYVFEEEDMLQLLVVSSLDGDPIPILKLARHTRNRGWVFDILQPTKPWIWGIDLVGSHRLLKHHSKLNRVFRRLGVKVATSVEDVYKDAQGVQSLVMLTT